MDQGDSGLRLSGNMVKAPMLLLAIVSDVAYGSQAYLKELAVDERGGERRQLGGLLRGLDIKFLRRSEGPRPHPRRPARD